MRSGRRECSSTKTVEIQGEAGIVFSTARRSGRSASFYHCWWRRHEDGTHYIQPRAHLPHADEAAGEADDGKDNADHAVLGLDIVFAASTASEDCSKRENVSVHILTAI